MKATVYASNASVGDVIYAAPKGRKSPVKFTVTAVGCTREWVIITGTRMLKGQPVTVECELLAFTPITLEM